jgi:hypothetical protein
MERRRRVADSVRADLDRGITLAVIPGDGTAEVTDRYLRPLINRLVLNQRPAIIQIVFASLGVILAVAAGALSFILAFIR